MRRIFCVVVDSHVGRPLPLHLALTNMFDEYFGGLVIGAFDFELQPMPRLEQDAIGPDLDVELINFIGRQQLPLRMKMYRLPWF